MAGITYDGIASTRIDTITGSGMYVYAGSAIVDGEGRIRSTVIGSATAQVFGGVLQTGSVVTSAGSLAFIAFGQPMPNTNYYVVASTTNPAAGDGTGSTCPAVSGTRSTSGVSLIGAASSRYAWMAIG